MKPKILVMDIETAPILAHVWQLFDVTVGLNQIVSDWHLLSWSAKWLGEKEIFYMDQRHEKNVQNDKKLLEGMWKLLDECDAVLTQNGKRFDIKKLNTRFVINGMQPPSSYKHIDTYQIAKSKFGFTSNKLEYMTDKLCTKYKKLKHKKFPGHEMWFECLKGNKKAWKAMEKYNKYDVLSLEELYTKLAPWESPINFSLYEDHLTPTCSCGSTKFIKIGYAYTGTGKFQRYRCKSCGSETRSRENLFTKEEKAKIRVAVK
jgi:hypothetical protein